MNLKGFKEKSNKNYINSELKSRSIAQSNTIIKSVGVIANAEELSDISIFYTLAKELNIRKDHLKLIAFKSEIKAEEEAFNPTYTLKDIGWKGRLKDKNLKAFLNTDFDVLISYYKKNSTALKVLTVASKSKFKVGILETDERINDLIIKTEIINLKTFTSELKKYLTILNKI